MHELTEELGDLTDIGRDARGLLPDGLPAAALAAALEKATRLERRELFVVRPELQLLLYGAVALLVTGVGLLVRDNLDRIGPLALLGGLGAMAALCYGVALRARAVGRPRTLGEDYVLLLGALLASAAVGYAEVQYHLIGTAWARHLLLLAGWHLGTAYLFRSRLVLAVALAAFAGWLGLEATLGNVFDPLRPSFGTGPRSLLCALLFYAGSHGHRAAGRHPDAGFRDVYLQFAANFGFWGALALGADADTRWLGALVLVVLAGLLGRLGFRENRQGFLLYAVGYSTVGLVWLESLLLRDFVMASWAGLLTVAAAVALLVSLRSKLAESAT